MTGFTLGISGVSGHVSSAALTATDSTLTVGGTTELEETSSVCTPISCVCTPVCVRTPSPIAALTIFTVSQSMNL